MACPHAPLDDRAFGARNTCLVCSERLAKSLRLANQSKTLHCQAVFVVVLTVNFNFNISHGSLFEVIGCRASVNATLFSVDST